MARIFACGYGVRLSAIGLLALPLVLMGGCPTDSDDIDLSERGVLSLLISRVSKSAVASASAEVTDSQLLPIPNRPIVLADDQIVRVNNVPLIKTARTVLGLEAVFAATIESVNEPDTYTLSFDNQGVVTTAEVAPPEDFEDVEPEAASQVARTGFDLEWDAADDANAVISIAITGSAWSYDADGALQIVPYTVTLSDIADDGDISIGAAELINFISGEITVTLSRVKVVSQKLGFSKGTIQVEIKHEIPLLLVEAQSGS